MNKIERTMRAEGSLDRAGVVSAALAALLFGVILLFGAGFAQSEALHNAAHDGRHSFAFPCH